jgi:hypothetical protein
VDRARFEKPVTVLVGMGFPASIESAMEAYALLQDWPAANRNHPHAVALNASKAGIAGEVDPETVRAAFIAFARRNDILMQDIGIPAASDRSMKRSCRISLAGRTRRRPCTSNARMKSCRSVHGVSPATIECTGLDP